MRITKIIRRRLDSADAQGSVVGDVNAVIAATVGEPAGSRNAVSSRQQVRVTQTRGAVRRDPAPAADAEKEQS